MILADHRSQFCVSAKWMLAAPQSYAFAAAAVLVAGTLRHLLEVHLGLTHPFILFYPVIVVAALWSSLNLALFTTVISALVAEYFFLEPLHSFAVSSLRDIFGLIVFGMVGFTIGLIGDQFRRRAQRLQEFEKAIEGVPEMIFVVDRDYRYRIANRMFLSYFGNRPQDLLGRQVSDVVGLDTFQNVLKPKLDECFGGRVVQFELRRSFPGRGERDLSVTYFPVQGAAGVHRITVVVQDITEK